MPVTKTAGEIALGLLALLLLSGVATAVPTVFHSPNDDGVPSPGQASVGLGVQTLHFYIDGGSQASVALPCEEGGGDEVCTWEVAIVPTGDVSFAGFSNAIGVESNLQSALLRAIGGDPLSGDLGPTKMGDLTINSVVGGTVELDRGDSVNAAQLLVALTAGELVSVPEPGVPLSLACGALGLQLLGRWRSRATGLQRGRPPPVVSKK